MSFNERQKTILATVIVYYLAHFDELNNSIFPEPWEDTIIPKTQKSEIEGMIQTMLEGEKEDK